MKDATSKPIQFWVPTFGNHCGISEYTAYLNQYANARIHNSPEDIDWKNGLVHVQHEYGYFDAPGRLAAYLYMMATNIPYVITEHTTTLGDKPEPFELYSSSIIVHTRAQYDIAHKRSKAHVHHIPHGTFDYGFKSKERTKTKVLGAFGFMNGNKGFDKILDFLDKNKDYSLLLFSSQVADSPFQRRMTKRISQMSNITWVSDYLPQKVVAERLRREADLLVYWYKPPPYLSASGAASIGLSTGVPVIGTRTVWFDDLPVVTSYRMTDGIKSLMEDEVLYREQSERQLEYAWENRWQVIAEKHQQLWSQLLEEKNTNAH